MTNEWRGLLRRGAVWAVAVTVGAVMAGACGAAAPTRTLTRTPAAAAAPGAACTIPALPAGGAGGLSSGRPLRGPAVTSLRGGPAQTSFSLDAGGLVVSPPGPDDRPVVTGGEAECDALASLNANNFSFSAMALESGIAIGYGRVSVRPSLLTASAPSPVVYGGGQKLPTLPPPTPYQNRLAWIVVFQWTAPINCPAIPVALPGKVAAATTPPAAPGPDYQVFLLDAKTGAGALVYTEGRPAPCGRPGTVAPAVNVPVEQYSVPWTLVSRQPGGYSAVITALVHPCEGYDPLVLASRLSGSVEVTVQGPVAPECGPASGVKMTLDAGTVTSRLPPALTHAPTGPFLDLPTPAPSR